ASSSARDRRASEGASTAVAEIVSGNADMDSLHQRRLALRERSDRERRRHAWRARIEGAVGDVQAGMAENLSAVIHHSLLRRAPHGAAAERVDGPQAGSAAAA